MNIHHFQVRKGTSHTAHKPSMKSVCFNFSKRITAASHLPFLQSYLCVHHVAAATNHNRTIQAKRLSTPIVPICQKLKTKRT